MARKKKNQRFHLVTLTRQQIARQLNELIIEEGLDIPRFTACDDRIDEAMILKIARAHQRRLLSLKPLTRAMKKSYKEVIDKS